MIVCRLMLPRFKKNYQNLSQELLGISSTQLSKLVIGTTSTQLKFFYSFIHFLLQRAMPCTFMRLTLFNIDSRYVFHHTIILVFHQSTLFGAYNQSLSIVVSIYRRRVSRKRRKIYRKNVSSRLFNLICCLTTFVLELSAGESVLS